MIDQNQCGHGFGDGDDAGGDAAVVAAEGLDDGVFVGFGDGFLGFWDAGNRLDGEADHDVLTGGDAAESAAGVV